VGLIGAEVNPVDGLGDAILDVDLEDEGLVSNVEVVLADEGTEEGLVGVLADTVDNGDVNATNRATTRGDQVVAVEVGVVGHTDVVGSINVGLEARSEDVGGHVEAASGAVEGGALGSANGVVLEGLEEGENIVEGPARVGLTPTVVVLSSTADEHGAVNGRGTTEGATLHHIQKKNISNTILRIYFLISG
jgi:hypothetical protein